MDFKTFSDDYTLKTIYAVSMLRDNGDSQVDQVLRTFDSESEAITYANLFANARVKGKRLAENSEDGYTRALDNKILTVVYVQKILHMIKSVPEIPVQEHDDVKRSKNGKWTRYTMESEGTLSRMPLIAVVNDEADRLYGRISDEMGFDGTEFVWIKRLTKEWEDHPAGALVVHGVPMPGDWYYVENVSAL